MTRPKPRYWPNRLGADFGSHASVMLCIGNLSVMVGSKILKFQDDSIRHETRADEIDPERYYAAIDKCRAEGRADD